MQKVELSLRFVIKKKTGESGLHTIFMRISLLGGVAFVSLQKDIDPKHWDIRNERPRPSYKDSYEVENQMSHLRHKALSIYHDLLDSKIDLHIDQIRERFSETRGRLSGEPHFLEVFQRMINRKTALPGKNNSPATVQKYRRCKTLLRDLVIQRFQCDDVPFGRINLGFVEDLEVFLRQKGCSHNTAMKYMQTVKSVFHYARAHGFVKHDPFLQFKIKIEEVERPYLNEDEINRLMHCHELPDSLGRVRDQFIFSCFTGVAYSDLRNLRMKHICYENGKYWLRTRRQKTQTRTNIPLLPVPLQLILGMHSGIDSDKPEQSVFSVVSNQKMNVHLKKLAVLCRITKHLTFHCARHTFATTVTLSNGVPIESVSSMLGHTQMKTTQHYARMIDKKLEEDMGKLESRIHNYSFISDESTR